VGIIIIILVSLLWSLVGIFVKIASLMVDSGTITFLRFFIGAIILGVIYRIHKGPLRILSRERWIWAGSFGKSANYLLENIGIVLGLSYGFIVGIPVSYILLLLASVFILKETVSRKHWAGASLALVGFVFMMLNGNSFADMVTEHGFVNLLFVLSGIGIAVHVFSQKVLTKQTDSLTMNVSTFFWCSVITAIPLPGTFEFKEFHIGALFSLIALGAITGLSFLWFSYALRTVPLFLATLVSNSTSVFIVIWGALFLGEAFSWQVLVGGLLFTAGMIVANFPSRQQQQIKACE
jgi:drug/metabolite transporter (DMT)-like permease